MTSIPSSTPDTTRSDLAAIVERDANVPWTAVFGTARWTDEAAWTAVEDRRVLLGLLLNARAALETVGECHGCIHYENDAALALLESLSVLDDTTRNDR